MVVSTILIILFADEDEKNAEYFPETVIITLFKECFLCIKRQKIIF